MMSHIIYTDSMLINNPYISTVLLQLFIVSYNKLYDAEMIFSKITRNMVFKLLFLLFVNFVHMCFLKSRQI